MSWSTNRIYDSHGRIVIAVEQRFLDLAVQRSSSCCAIAIALKHAIPDAKFIQADLMWIKFTRNGRRFRMQTPAIGRDCILKLDAGNAVAPFVLKLRPEFIPSRPRAELRRQQRAEAAVKASPEKSDRAIADELGISDMTVGRARKRTATHVAVEKRTGKDGKQRRPSVAVTSTREHGLRMYKRAEAPSKPSPPPRPVPSEMTKSALRRELELAVLNTAKMDVEAPQSLREHA